ncbi:hypothetical protein BH23ACT1_BH23ACT1_03220 [soil metagenome]
MVGFIVFGMVVGIVARLLVPGRQHLSIWMTLLLGVLGSVVGGVVANLLSSRMSPVPSIIGALVAFAAAVVLIVVGEQVGVIRRRSHRD